MQQHLDAAMDTGVDRDRFSERLPVMHGAPDCPQPSDLPRTDHERKQKDRASGDPSHGNRLDSEILDDCGTEITDRQDCLPLQREESDRCRSRAAAVRRPDSQSSPERRGELAARQPMPGAGVIVRRTLQPAAHDELPHGSGERAKQQRGPRRDYGHLATIDAVNELLIASITD